MADTVGSESAAIGAAGSTSRRDRGVQGERRIVTVLFCDVAGSTAMAEQLDPEEWAEIMQEAFAYMTGPVDRYEGNVARLMGDAILAFFGAPVAHEEDPQRAVLAGLDIIEGIAPFREEIREEYGLDFNLRVGINTGPVVVGDVGSEVGGEYTAMGDAVNVAARMEQTAKPGTVQISGETQKLIAPLFDFEALGVIEVKGKGEPVPAFSVLGRKAQPGRVRGIEGLNAPMIGRDQQFDLLKQVVKEVREGRGQIVGLVGEAGLGKSRLIEEVRREWHEEDANDLSWIESRGISFDTTRPYGQFQQQVRRIYGVEENDAADVVAEKLSITIDTFPDGMQETLKSVVELLLQSRSSNGGPSLEGETFKREVFDGVLNIWRAAAESGPRVLVFDDLHWADPASNELLLHLMQLAEEVPILFLFAMRPERRAPSWRVKQTADAEYPHLYSEINLEPLSAEDSDSLVESLLTISDLPANARKLILDKTDGNPFFLEEVVRTLIDSGAVVRDETGTRWMTATRTEDIAIPDSLQALLISRFDRLEEEARSVLQLASVVGRSFYYRVLKLISDTAVALDKQLSTLQRVELIREAARVPELEYVFKHELTREAAYNSILRRQCRRFHRRVGEALESCSQTAWRNMRSGSATTSPRRSTTPRR